jgi:hypothetical protein
MRKHRISGILALIGVALLLQAADCRAEDASCRSAEYEVMSLLIREQYGSEFNLILINRDTEPWCLREQLTFLQRSWPGLRNETIDSLIVSNSGASSRLAERFHLPVEYRLVSDQEYLQALLDNTDQSEGGTLQADAGSASSGTEAYASISSAVEPDWDSFDRVFPDAQGYLTFSKVGFDSGCTQALVIFSNAYRCSGARFRPATRKIAFFSREKGTWELVGVSRGIDAIY